MTIRHKKKNVERPLDSESSESSSVHASSHLVHHPQPNQSHPQLPVACGPTAIERLFASATAASFSDYETHESASSGSSVNAGVSVASVAPAQSQQASASSSATVKRRHRVSPHRSARCHKQARTERAAVSPTFVLPSSSVTSNATVTSAESAVHLLETGHAHLLETGHAHRLDTGHAHRLDTGHAHRLDTGHAHRLDTGHAHRLDTGHAHLLETGHAHRLDTGHAHLLETGHAHRLDSGHAHLSESDGEHTVYADAAGYNSGDEYGSGDVQLTEEQWQEKERQFERKLKRRGLSIKRMVEDGACLFRAVADQLYGDEEMHVNVRNFCMDYISANADYFSQYITEDFDEYVHRKRLNFVHGNHIEIQAISEMYNRHVEVLCYNTEAINIFHGRQDLPVATGSGGATSGSASGGATTATCNTGAGVGGATNGGGGGGVSTPIRLSYHRGTHYNSVINPYTATIGLGLGLPGLVPGLADRQLLREAAACSEQQHIEQTMLEDKLRATDWEATDDTLAEQVARESYLQWLKDNEKRNKSSCASSSAASSADARSPRHHSARGGGASDVSSPLIGQHSPARSPLTNRSARLSPRPTSDSAHSPAPTNQSAAQDRVRSEPGPSHVLGFPLHETASFIDQLPPQVFGLSGEWEDAGVLARVLAQSQQEYLDRLKETAIGTDTTSSSSSSSLSTDAPGSVASTSSSTCSTSSRYDDPAPSTSKRRQY